MTGDLTAEALCERAVESLDALKARDAVVLDVRQATDIADFMVIVTGTSNRHVHALVDHLVTDCKASDIPVLGVEGRETNEWVLVDLGDVLVHVMLKQARELYDLERLWAPMMTESPADTDRVR